MMLFPASELPLKIRAIKYGLADRFWPKAARAGPDDCWEWQCKRRADGYGVFSVDGKRFKATHVALELSGSPRPHNEQALHSCDNRGCVNPNHLRWGTAGDNTKDKVERDRCSRDHGLKGESNPKAILTDHKVRAIRHSPRGYKALARQYGVERTTIRSIKRRETWRHVGD